MPRYPIVVEVKEVRPDLPPPCPVHKVGDRFTINGVTCEGKICHAVLVQQGARLWALAQGLPSPNVITYKCPDQGKVTFEFRRDPDRWYKDAISPLTKAPVKAPGPLV